MSASERFTHEPPRPLACERLEAVRQLADDLPGLWAAATTTVVDRKEILRAVIERIALRVIGESEQVQVDITWAGGHVTRGVVCRPVRRLEQLSTLRLRARAPRSRPACRPASARQPPRRG